MLFLVLFNYFFFYCSLYCIIVKFLFSVQRPPKIDQELLMLGRDDL